MEGSAAANNAEMCAGLSDTADGEAGSMFMFSPTSLWRFSEVFSPSTCMYIDVNVNINVCLSL